MSLRVKVELVLVAAIAMLLGLGYGFQRYLLLEQLDPLEEEIAAGGMIRCIDTLNRQLGSLHAFAADWSVRPDVAAKCTAANPEGDVNDLLKNAVDANAVGFLYIVGADHGVRCGAFRAPGARQATASTDITADVAGLNWEPLLGDAAKGIALASNSAVLLSVVPVSGDVSVMGWILAGQCIDERLMRILSRQSGVAFQCWAATDPALPSEARGALDRLNSRGVSVDVRPVSNTIMRTYGRFPGMDGTPTLVLQTDIQRDVLARIHEALQSGLLAQIGLAMAAMVVLIAVFRRGVTTPLARLTRHVTGVAQSNDLSARLHMRRTDENGILAREFDRMIELLDEDRRMQREAEDALRRSEERFAAAVDGANDGLWDWDLLKGTVYLAPRWKSMLGYAEGDLGEDPNGWLALIHKEDMPYVQATLDAHLKGESDHFEAEYRILHNDGTYLWVLCRGLAVRDGEGRPVRIAGSQTDITPRKRVEEQLAHQAFHDALTGLPNRALFLDRLSQALRHSLRNQGYLFAVLFLDLDRFKVVNDGLGHVVGDKLLKAFADILAAALRASDTIARFEGTVARFGGDEFVILLDGIRDPADATRVAGRILELLKRPFHIEEHEVFTSVSIGIAVSAAGYDNPEEFLRNADTAMYRAKGRGKACYEVFDLDMHSRAIERLELETDLRRAIEREEFCVYYQPIVSLKSGRLEAFEALVRWNHPVRGMISPARFIPIAEETGMILPIGEMMFRIACAQTRSWQMQYPYAGNLSISINLSVKEFARPDLLESIEQTLRETGLSPRHLKLEITESAVIENVEHVTNTLLKFRSKGIQLSIDDFGTGYSSLSYLHRFPLNNLKIDQIFVREMHLATENLLIVKTILMLAQNLRMSVIAEGIENGEQLGVLCRHQCDYGQGYFFARPLDAEAAGKLLKDGTTWKAELDVARDSDHLASATHGEDAP